MVKRIAIQKIKAEKEPYLTWDSFIHLIAFSKTEELNEIQSVAQLAWWYDSEVQNGGHLQYFENKYILHKDKLLHLVLATVKALKIIGATKQSKILSQALNKYLSRVRKHPSTVKDFCKLELANEFGKLDDKYYGCSPEMNYYLKNYSNIHVDDFIEFV